MSLIRHETVFALSSAVGRAGVAVIRISGPAAWSALRALAPTAQQKPRSAQRVRLREPVTGALLDDGLALWFPGPASFTGEDTVELQTHGGQAVVAGVLAALAALDGLRLAKPGEFTRQAFENGKLDLTEAEGLADLIDAETETQRAQALRQMGGALRAAAEHWRDEIIAAQALAEAAIDFSDEGDVSAGAFAQAQRLAGALRETLRMHLDDGYKGEILRDGFRIAVAGTPNVGKSSLINRLAMRDVVIVSPEAGTTRDVVELHLNLNGIRVVIADTAGIRTAPGPVEQEGIRRGLAWAQKAHLVVWLIDATAPDLKLPNILLDRLDSVLPVLTKRDLIPTDRADREMQFFSAGSSFPSPMLAISNATGGGLDALIERLGVQALASTDNGHGSLITQVRHRACIARACESLEAAAITRGDAVELAAEHLRIAAHALEELTGRVDVEHILGAIFSRFCIGK